MGEWAGAWRRLLVLLLALAGPGIAIAHEMSMVELELREVSKGDFTWFWGPGSTGPRAVSADLTPVWPQGCVEQEQALHCSAPGLAGTLAVKGVGRAYSAAMVRVHWLDGQTRVYTITAAQPTVQLYGAANDERGAGEVVAAYTVLGIEHILSGYDHLLFVLALLFLVGFRGRLVGVISAFTVAHSLALASSALGWLTLRPAPVEAAIALSILLVVAESLNTRQTLARRWPALVAFLFGLVHGLGFAGALKEIGLPESHLPLALLSFNVGVEAGQLAVVLLAWLLTRWLSRYGWFARSRKPLLYAIGITASYWSWLRLAAIGT